MVPQCGVAHALLRCAFLPLLDLSMSLPSWKVVGLRLGEALRCQVAECLSTPLSVLCHFVALADCIRSGYVGGQLVITRNISSSFFTSLVIVQKDWVLCWYSEIVASRAWILLSKWESPPPPPPTSHVTIFKILLFL